MTPSQILRKRSEETGINQGELAFRCGCSRSFMNDVFSDRRKPSPEAAKVLFISLNLSAEDRNACIDAWSPTLIKWEELRRG